MRRWIWLLVVVVALIFGAGAIPGSPVISWLVNLLADSEWTGRTAELTPVLETPPRNQPLLRVAIGAMVTPERTYSDYRDLFALLAGRLGRKLDLIQRKTYSEINDLIDERRVDLAWVCTGALRDLESRHRRIRLVAVPVIRGRTDYRAYLIVRRNSPDEKIEDLEGKVFAFTDFLSLTGRKVVMDLLSERGKRVDDFFGRTFYTHAHDNSIRAVAEGLADAACVDSLVYDFLAERNPDDTADTRIIWRSKTFPIPPLVAPPTLDEGLFLEMRATLISLQSDPAAQRMLEHLGVDRFARGDSGLYSLE